VREPETLEDWAEFHPKVQVLPWLAGSKHARIQRLREYVRLAYGNGHMVVRGPRGMKGWIEALLRVIARARVRSLLLRFPFEVWTLRAWRSLRRTPAAAVIN
jgi:hypothetical protein